MQYPIRLFFLFFTSFFYFFFLLLLFQTIPRDVTVSFAVFEVEEELLKGAFKLYPKLKVFWDVRKEKIGIFEYGCCLKAFPDEPIVVLIKEVVVQEQKNFFTNW